MTLLKISRMGHPVLRRVAATIPDPTAPAIRTLAADMIATMVDAEGVGLAAPQVYQGLRLIVLRVPADRGGEAVPAAAIVNPVFEPLDEALELGWEGCLSIPGLRGMVPRFATISLRGLTPEGKPVDRVATGFHARIVQHEVDHLDGILYLDRMIDLRTLTFEDQWKHGLSPAPGDDGSEA